MGMRGMRLSPPQICLGLMVALITSAPFTGAIASAPEQGQAAVLLNPSLSRADQLRRISDAGAELVRFGAVPGAVIVNMTPASGPAELRAAGAWIISYPVIPGTCSELGSQYGGIL